jgi:hypothetical protein
MMLLRVEVEKRAQGWYVDVRDVPGTASMGATREAALAETLRKLAAKAERHELDASFDTLITETPPPGQKPSTCADLLALWRSLSHDDPTWADDLEKITRSQPTTADEPSAWER